MQPCVGLTLSNFLSGEHIDVEDRLSMHIHALKNENKHISTFFLSMPDRKIEIKEFDMLMDGLNKAKIKLQKVIDFIGDMQDD
jgi:CRISPR/Cas system CMR-associated protein Cmr5 small subunit